MQNKQGYTNGTSTGSFTDSQISYDVQASPTGYWEYTVYGKLDISKIKGKTFNIIYNFEDVVLPSEPGRFSLNVLYSANGNFILPAFLNGGPSSGTNFAGIAGTERTRVILSTGGNQQIIQSGIPLFSGVSEDIVDFYICCFYAPQSSQSTRPSGKIKITLTTNSVIETLSFVKNGRQNTNLNITPTDYTSQGGNVIQPTITQGDGYVEIETTHTNTNDPWWDCILYNSLTTDQINAIKQSTNVYIVCLALQ